MRSEEGDPEEQPEPPALERFAPAGYAQEWCESHPGDESEVGRRPGEAEGEARQQHDDVGAGSRPPGAGEYGHVPTGPR